MVFGGLNGMLIGADGLMTRDLRTPRSSAPPVIDPPPIIDPPPVTSAAVPELSTWAMMLVGLVGLGLAAQAPRSAFLGGRPEPASRLLALGSGVGSI